MERLTFSEFKKQTTSFIKERGKRGNIDFFGYVASDIMYFLNNDSQIFCEFEITTDFENEYYMFQNYTISDVKNLLKITENCLKNEKYIFIETQKIIKKGFTKFNSFEIPLVLKNIEFQQFMRYESELLFKSLPKPKIENFENGIDLNQFKKQLIEAKSSNHGFCYLTFDSENINVSNGIYFYSVAKNTTNFKNHLLRLENSKIEKMDLNQKWNELKQNDSILEMDLESKNKEFLFSIESKELKLILKQANLISDTKGLKWIAIKDGIFFTHATQSLYDGYQYEYEFLNFVNHDLYIFDFENLSSLISKTKKIEIYISQNMIYFQSDVNTITQLLIADKENYSNIDDFINQSKNIGVEL